MIRTAGLTLSHLDHAEAHSRVLSTAIHFHRQGILKPKISPLWPAYYFNLHQSTLFQNASFSQQQYILSLATQQILEEAYFLEKASIQYMGKLSQLAETVEERMLYALFTADETYHLAQIMRFLPEQPKENKDAFLRFLGNVVECNDKTVLLFVLQVVLEGWGLTHYQNLAQHCLNSEFKQVLNGFIPDESKHHITGMTLLKRSSLSPTSSQGIIETLATFLPMIQVGPQKIISAVEQGLGHLSRFQKIQLLEELDTENQSGMRLKRLHNLIGKYSTGMILQELENRGLFAPFPASICIEI